MLHVLQRSASIACGRSLRVSLANPGQASNTLAACSSGPREREPSHRKRHASSATSGRLSDITLSLHGAISNVERTLESMQDYVNFDRVERDIHQAQSALEDPQLWISNPAGAAKAQSRLADLQHQLSTRTRLRSSLKRLQELAALAEKAGDLDVQSAVLLDLQGLLHSAQEHLVSLWLSDPVDQNSAFIDIQVNSEGPEACDWACRLARMYTRWAHSKNYVVTTVEEAHGDFTGVKATTLLVEGRYAYGYAQYESGIHSLVTTPSFDKVGGSDAWSASVRVSPCIEDDGPGDIVELNPADLQVTTVPLQEAGKQHVNEAESAVRVMHIPTGTTVSCRQGRSQYHNQALALSLLKARLYDLERRKRGQSATDAPSTQPENSWDSQIRTYTLQPDNRLVRDLRTGYEVGSNAVQDVLDGNLTGFMEASLRRFRKK
ncbi:release factor [Pilatotrama ljubarskyi]|nr:release factor [Pilatotrama ljubarskyi]